MNIMTKMTNSAANMVTTSLENAKDIEESLENYEEDLENALDALDDLDW
jgi:hypothetical protein